MYIDFDDYSEVYKDLTAENFAYLCFKACLELDKQTKGIDGYSKLDNAYPEEKKAAMAVKVCAIELVHLLNQFHIAENAIGFEKTDNGYVGKQINSVSSGSESISFSAGNNTYAAENKRSMINSLVREYLSGVTDKNGVNLLFMGEYPYVYKHDNNI